MANEQTTLIRVAVAGAIAVGPFRAGKAYAVPADAVPLLGARFAAATLASGEQPVALGEAHKEMIEALRASKRGADDAAAAAKAKAAAAGAEKTTPAAAGSNVTGG